MADQSIAIGGISDPSLIRVKLLASGREVHTPLEQIVTALNLKVLNADGGFSFATTADPSINIDGAFGGTWKTSHRFHSTGTGTANLGTYATASISRKADGLAADGATNSDLALFLDVQHTNYLTSETGGQVLGTYTVIRGNRTGDHAAHLIDARKVFAGTYNGSVLGIEALVAKVNAAGTITQHTQSYVGWAMSATGTNFAPDGVLGFCTEPRVGETFAGYAAIERSDLSGPPAFEWCFVGSSSRNNANIFGGMTGTNHTAGPGRFHATTSAGFPGFSFIGDTNTGVGSPAADEVGLYAAGVARFWATTAHINTTVPLRNNGTQVLGAQGAAVADATDAASVITQLNALLARCRAHGLIAT